MTKILLLTKLVEDGLSLSSERPDDPLDDLDESHLNPGSHLDQPDRTVGSLAVASSDIVRRELDL